MLKYNKASHFFLYRFTGNCNLIDLRPIRSVTREINRFHTDLREVLLYIKYSKEKEKLVDLIQTDDGFPEHEDRNG